MFADGYVARNCGLDTLKTTIQAARDGTAAAVRGDETMAAERFDTYETEFDSYRQNCL